MHGYMNVKFVYGQTYRKISLWTVLLRPAAVCYSTSNKWTDEHWVLFAQSFQLPVADQSPSAAQKFIGWR